MKETKSLLEVTKDEIKRISWFSSENQNAQSEVMSRLIIWEDDISEGIVEFVCQEKKLYDRIIDHFNIKKKKKASSEFDIFTDFELSTKMYTTEWSPPEGTITYYYRWYSKSGRIEFEIMGKNLFDKFAAYAKMFKP